MIGFRYRLHDPEGEDLGVLEHPASNLEPGDVVVLADGREALVTARAEAEPRSLAALLEVVVMTAAPLHKVETTTEEQLDMLRSERTPTDARVWVTHFFSHFFSTEPERKAFRDAIRAGGFGTEPGFRGIGSDEEMTGGGYWHHYAFTVLTAAADELSRADERAREIAAQHGVDYDGWQVQRNGISGRPRSVDPD